MRRLLIALGLLYIVGICASAAGIGIIQDSDFLAVGVKKENLERVKRIIAEADKKRKIQILDEESIKAEINKSVLQGVSSSKINLLVDKLMKVEGEILKNKLRYQMEVQKYITRSQYMAARDIALRRMAKSMQLNNR